MFFSKYYHLLNLVINTQECIIKQNREILKHLERLNEAVPETVKEAKKSKEFYEFMEEFIKEFGD